MAALTASAFDARPSAVVAAVTGVGVMAAAGAARRATGSTARSATRQRLVEPRSSTGRWRLWGRVTAIMVAVRALLTGGDDQRRVLVDGLPAVLEDVARGVRAGSSLRQACADAAATGGLAGSRLAAAIAHAERGLALPKAFAAWAAGSAAPEERLAAGALALVATTGGPQARAVDGVAATLRDRRAVAAEVRAQSAQARLSAVVIGVLPAVFLAWVALTDQRTAGFLIAGPPGWACLVGGVGLELTGGLWMRHLLRGASP